MLLNWRQNNQESGLNFPAGGVELITDINMMLLSQGPLCRSTGVTDCGPRSKAIQVPVLTLELEQLTMILILLNLVLERRRKKRNRKFCVHHIFTFRLTNATFLALFGESGKDERSLFNYFSMYISSCSELHKTIQDPFQETDTNMGRYHTAKEGFAVVPRYMCEFHGCFAVKGDQYNRISL